MKRISTKRLLKRDWDWFKASGHQKELYIKTLGLLINEQDKRIAELEKLVSGRKGNDGE